MKIGIIVYSNTGNTYSVAEKLYKGLFKKGQSVTIDRIEVNRDMKKAPNKIDFVKNPDVKKYDAIILASPVEAFSLCPVMKNYLEGISSLKGKRIACFVTEYLPFAWMGGNNAIKQMKTICEGKDAIVCRTDVINWKNKHREEMIDHLVSEFTRSFDSNK